MRFVIVTMDTHLASAAERAGRVLARDLPGLTLSLHAAADWQSDDAKLQHCLRDIAAADILVVTMLFMEEHFQPVLSAIKARRGNCDAIVCAMSAGEVARMTLLGQFDMDGPTSGPMALLKKLRGKKDAKAPVGARQMQMLRRIPQILRFIPGTAQDVRAYFLTLQYWLGGSEENIANMVRFLVSRYASGPRHALRQKLKVASPAEYPEVGIYHPAMKPRLSEQASALPPGPKEAAGTVGLLLLRSYLLAGNSAHYDGVIRSFENRGMKVIPAFATGLDSRPAIEQFFVKDGQPVVDAVVSLTGFSLVGGPAYNDSKAAEDVLAGLDVPYLAAHPVEFQTLQQWGGSERGLMPVEATIMVAIPELDGAIAPSIFGGRAEAAGTSCSGCRKNCSFPASETGRDMHVCPERADALTARVGKLVAMKRAERRDRKLAIVLFSFPPNAGNIGTAAHLSVYQSLHNTLVAMQANGYTVNPPATAEALAADLLGGNAARYGAPANVHARIPADDHVRREPWLREIEAQWGPAPGKHQSDGASIQVYGVQYGNVFIGVQPAFGYEGDPMRLLFEKGFAPTHAFSAFYRWIREDFGAHSVLHFGTHGALEFMPGKQTGMSGACWPERLIGDLPNLYLYASNNPSEGTIAKRRAGATLISYLTPPVTNAGLYRGLADLKASMERWRALPDSHDQERARLAELIQAQANELDLAAAEPAWGEAAAEQVSRLTSRVLELEYTLIPHGLHVVGAPMTAEERVDMLAAMVESSESPGMPRPALEAIIAGKSPKAALEVAGLPPAEAQALMPTAEMLERTDRHLRADSEVSAILHALDGGYTRPAPGGDLLRTTEILPTGRNLHGFDPFRIPSAYAIADGMRQANRLLQRHFADGNALPESIAMVLWGTDNLKTEGGPIGQALALVGARPRFDGYGRLAGATLIPLEELGRPRIDVVISLSGIFRDLMPLQIRLLAEATYLAASADEPLESNFVRKHALAYQVEHSCDLETAALRIYGNADGAYGSNVNHMVENSRWDDEDELAETYSRRKCFAFGRNGRPVAQAALMRSTLADVELTYQNLDSVELGVTTVDTYFDTLGGVTRAVRKARGNVAAPVYIGDQTRGEGTVRTLDEQVALETRTRVLNPKWYEGMLKHGYEGVRQIEVHVTNTMGWSATTGQVQPWVYQQITQTFMLDPEMRERLAQLNPTASARVANRLIEASERSYWKPDSAMLDALRRAGEELEDHMEGIQQRAAA